MATFLSQLQGRKPKKLPIPEVPRPAPLMLVGGDISAPELDFTPMEDVSGVEIEDVNDQNRKYRWTRLHQAIMEIEDPVERMREVRVLVGLNADPLRKDSSNETAIDKARDEGYEDIVLILEAHVLTRQLGSFPK